MRGRFNWGPVTYLGPTAMTAAKPGSTPTWTRPLKLRRPRSVEQPTKATQAHSLNLRNAGLVLSRRDGDNTTETKSV
jgi:hypothetical protein